MVYVTYIVETEAVNANNNKTYIYISAVSYNVAVRGDSSPCSRGLWLLPLVHVCGWLPAIVSYFVGLFGGVDISGDTAVRSPLRRADSARVAGDASWRRRGGNGHREDVVV